MKRSEMRNHIAQVVVAHVDKSCKHWNIEKMELLCKNLLDKIEALGMKAPETPFWNRRPDGTLMPHAKNGDTINEWDKE